MDIRLFFIAALVVACVPVHSKFTEGFCSNNSCHNGGECVQSEFAGRPYHWCLCPPGYSGAHCQRTPCPEDFCENDSVCERATKGELNDFYCKCPIGFKGQFCEDDVEDSICIREDPCHFGRCILTTSLEDYRCECMNGYKGENCTIKTLCPAGHCGHGTCTDESGRPECICPPNFSGKHCEHDVDECLKSPCLNGAACMNKYGTFECHCAHGFFGDRCEFNASLFVASEKNCTEEGEEACLHGGVCRMDVFSSVRSCLCPPMYQGARCELDVDECESGSTCMNGASCINFAGGFRCSCPMGYEGEYCEVKQLCDPDPCQAGGHCVAGDPHTCNCPEGRVGQFCQYENICLANNPCQNGGTCNVDAMTGNFTCECHRGYTGHLCDEDVDECADGSALCYNKGSCVNIPGSYECACPKPYSGRFCEEVLSNCHSKPCKNNGTCLSLLDTYVCRCPVGYVGNDCERKAPTVLICRASECHNGGRCKAGRCVCAEGFEGPKCDQQIKPRTKHCLANPCSRGFCQEEDDDYRCHCYPGFTGRNCEVDVDDCKPGICGDSGVCIDGENSYTCSCKQGFTGRHCEQKIDLDNFNRKEMRDKELCESYQCAALAGNGRCDQECNHFACGFDGGDCSAKAKPYERCPNASYCTRVFHDGNCDEICNNEACLFDGFDCSGSPSKCPNATFCEKNYGNGRCDPLCNNTACAFDGGDCETPEVEEKLNGEVVLVVLTSPTDFRSRVNQFLMTLGGALRSSVTIRSDAEGPMVYEWKDGVTGNRVALDSQQPLSVNFIGVVRGKRDSAEEGVIVWLTIDVTNCRRDCFSDIATVADFLGRAEAKQELEELGMPIKEARVSRGGNDGTGLNSNALLAAGSVLAALMLVLVVAIVVNNARERSRKRKIINAPTWFPPTDTQYKIMQHQAAEFSRNQSMHSLYQGEDIYSSIKRSRIDAPPVMPSFPNYTDPFPYSNQVFVQPKRPPVFPEYSELHQQASSFGTIPLPIDTLLVNERNGPGGVTPLLLVARNKDKTAQELLTDVDNLFRAGANLDAQNEDEQTALFIACKLGRRELVKRLLELGADPCKMDKTDSTPLHQAANNGDIAVAKELLKKEAVRNEINEVDKTGKTALMASAFYDFFSTEVAAALIEAGADPSYQGDKGALSYRGRSAVHYAAQYSNLKMLRFLLDKGANKDGQDLEECTPLILATKEGHVDVVTMLVAAGASQDISDQTDNTPRTLAKARNMDTILEILDKGRKSYDDGVPLVESRPVKVPVKRMAQKRKPQQPLTPPHSDGTSTPPDAFQLGRPLLYTTGMDSPSSEGSSNKTSSPTYHQLGAPNASYLKHSPPYDLDWTNHGMMQPGFMPPVMQQTFTSDYQSAGTSFDTSSFHLGADMSNGSNPGVWN